MKNAAAVEGVFDILSTNNPLISVIIPTYNRSSVIGRAIESVLRQSWGYFEIIVVDDGSTDNTSEMVGKYTDRRIHYIRHKTNQNGAAARNTGIKVSNGDYIAFLDSDDEWLDLKLEKQIKQFRERGSEEKVISYTQLKADNDNGMYEVVMPAKGKEPNEALGDYLFVNDGMMQTSTLMMPRSLAMDNLFNPKLKRHQDWDLCLRLEKRGVHFMFLQEPLVKWHVGESAGRVSKSLNYNLSLEWLESIRDDISEKARAGFLAKTVGEIAVLKGQRFYAIKLLLAAVLVKGVTFSNFNMRLISYILPTALWPVARKIKFWIMRNQSQ